MATLQLSLPPDQGPPDLDLLFSIAGKECPDDYALALEQVTERCAVLQDDNLRLRWCLREIRETLERAPDRKLPRAARLKVWARLTLVQIFTRSLPRMTVIWGGAATVAYVVHIFMRS